MPRPKRKFYESMKKILVDGQILAKEYRYLLRLVVKGTYGNNWIKWVNRVEIE
jgi:DMSO/TMAO reductase YedYZ molybdopterin-dependent catalytic subunit